MKKSILHLVSPIRLGICLFAFLCLSSIRSVSSQPLIDTYFCPPLDFEIPEHDSLYAAQKQALALNVGEPRTVRLIYFLPNDRPFRAEVVDSIKSKICQIQTFYAEQMQAHGYGRKTFRFETDARSEPMVHIVAGRYPDSHYLRKTAINVVAEEIGYEFDLRKNIYIIAIDNSINAIRSRNGQLSRGIGGRRGKHGGVALFPGRSSFATAAHELGHALGLWHNFNDNAYIMSYGGRQRNSLSVCHAKFLAVHPYFNSNIPIEKGQPPISIKLISPPAYPAGLKNVPIHLKVNNSEGIHQVILSVLGFSKFEVKTCRGLAAVRDTVVKFEYDGVIPSSSFSTLSDTIAHSISVQAVNTKGDVRMAYFVLTEISPPHIATLEGHTDRVASMSFSPDGKMIASGSWDGTIKLWDVETRKHIATLKGHEGGVTSMSFSPDGKMIASGSWDGTGKLWDIETREHIATLAGHADGVKSVSFSPGGKMIASGSWDRTVKLWDVETRKHIATLNGHGKRVESVSFSPDGKMIASGSGDRTVKLWDIETRKHIATLNGHGKGITSVSFLPDGKMIASGSGDRTVMLWDIETRKHIATLAGHTGGVKSVSFSPDGKMIASGSRDRTVKLWDVETRKHIATLNGHERGGLVRIVLSQWKNDRFRGTR